MAPLTRIGDGLGARIETVVDPITNIALRSRIYYLGECERRREESRSLAHTRSRCR